MKEQVVPVENDLVFIGVCGERTDIPEFGESKDSILLRGARHIKQMHITRGHRVDRNRDNIVLAFLERKDKPDWLLFLDSDMTFPEDIVYRLMSHRKPVVGGLYFHRRDHTPFVFRETGRKRDRWGRMIRMHEYMYDEVYDFLKRANIPLRNQAVAVDGVPGRLLKCDAVATGAMMVHRTVFEKIEGPWFEYVEHAESEDLSFCRYAREHGFDVYADLGTICGHLVTKPEGYAQFLQSYRERGVRALNYTFEDAASMLAELAGVPQAEQMLKEYTPHVLAEHYEDMKEDDGVRDIDFYRNKKTGELYIMELLHWNASPMFADFRNRLVGQENKRVLEIGAGIGTVTLQLAAQNCDVDVFEANGQLNKFAKKRFDWLKEKEKFIGKLGKVSWYGALRKGARKPVPMADYDLVVAIDVLEHLDEEELEWAIKYISEYLKPGGYMFCHNAWGDHTTDGVHPFHYDHSGIWHELLHKYGLFQTGEYWVVKEIVYE